MDVELGCGAFRSLSVTVSSRCTYKLRSRCHPHCEERNFAAARKGFGNDEDFLFLSNMHRRKGFGKTPFLSSGTKGL